MTILDVRVDRVISDCPSLFSDIDRDLHAEPQLKDLNSAMFSSNSKLSVALTPDAEEAIIQVYNVALSFIFK